MRRLLIYIPPPTFPNLRLTFLVSAYKKRLVTAAARRALEASSPQRRAVAAGDPTGGTIAVGRTTSGMTNSKKGQKCCRSSQPTDDRRHRQHVHPDYLLYSRTAAVICGVRPDIWPISRTAAVICGARPDIRSVFRMAAAV